MMDNDVEILFPDVELTLRTAQGEEDVTVREFRFGQAARVMPIAKDLLADFAAVTLDDDDTTSLHALQAKHWDAFLDLLAISTGKPRAWLEALPDEAGQLIGFAFWQANGPFFVRRLVAEAEMLRGAFASQMSSMSSSEPATAATPETLPGD